MVRRALAGSLTLGCLLVTARGAAAQHPGERRLPDSSRTTARRPPPLPVEALLQAPTLAAFVPAASFSTDGRQLAYTVVDHSRRRGGTSCAQEHRTGVPGWAKGADVWLSDLTTGARRNLTGRQETNWAPSWAPDGRSLAFFSDRSAGHTAPAGPARLWLWERSSNTLRPVSRLPVRTVISSRTGIQWLADQRSVLIAGYPGGMPPEAFAAVLACDRPPRAPTPAGTTATVYSFDPAGPDSVPPTDQVNLDVLRVDLAQLDTKTGALRPFARDGRIFDYALSPDRRQVVYAIAKGFERPGSGQLIADLIVHDFNTGRTRSIAAGVRSRIEPSGLFSWSPSGTEVVYRTQGPLAKDEVYLVPIAGGPVRRIAEGPSGELLATADRPAWGRAGRHVYFSREGALWRAPHDGSGAARFAALPGRELQIIETEGRQLWAPGNGRSALVFTRDPATKRVGAARVDLGSGTVTQLYEEDKRYGGYDNTAVVAPDANAVAYVAEDAQHPADIWLLEGERAQRRQVSRAAPELAQYRLGTAQVIEWRGLDGDTLRGALVYPAAYEPGRRYPLIVVVYGGSAVSNMLNRFGFHVAPVENLHLFATRGYALLLADSRLRVGTPMVDLLKSVMPGVNRAIDLGVADPARLGVMGHSYGGYSTLALVAQSPRFKAAVMRAGMGDLIGGYGQLAPDGTNYGLPWAESGQGRMGGSPWEYRERYLENSPFYHLDRVETPVLIVHGAADDAVPSFLADEVFVGLRRLGKPVTYAKYAGEGHWEGEWSYANQVDYLTRVFAWFDRYLPPTRH
ncbi:MAG: S9 family peptidase [Gemmatimonadales bacterium]